MTADTVGGVWTYALELARALRPSGVEVVLAAMGEPPSDDQRRAATELSNVVPAFATFKLEWMNQPWKDVEAAGEWLLGLEAEFQPDLIHLNSYSHATLRWQAPTLVVGHSCVCSWFAAVRGEAPPRSFARYRREVASGLQAAGTVTAPTEAMLEALREHYGDFPARAAIPNGRRAEGLRRTAKGSFVLYAGRLWDEAKNVSILERAAARIDWPVYLAGEARNPDGGEIFFRRAESLGRLSSVQLGDWLSRASIFALPALYEPFGLSALEAAQAGCALVLGDIPSLREVWGEAALFVPPEDEDAVAAALNLLIRRPAIRREFAVRARERAARYTPEQMAATYLEAYAELLRPKSLFARVTASPISRGKRATAAAG
jgi:glycogen synthase